MIQDRLILLGVAGLAAVAAAGWMRTPAVVPSPSLAEVQPELQAPLAPAAEAVMYAPASEAALAPAYPVRRVTGAQPAPNNVRYRDEGVATRARSAPVVYDDRGATAPKKRSSLGSAAIIGGGAAAGAAIGAAVGGGKGAAIGALAGGGAGLVYDRMTKNRQEPSDQYAYRTSRDDERTRSTGKSAAIVGGGAAAGAAVGAAAGGGKGAVIGALGGGAAGYVYDRMTRNK
jgi:hypothetical protein